MILCVTAGTAHAEEYFIRFRTPECFQMFMHSGIGKLASIREFFGAKIKRTFSFGSFRGITIDVSEDVMKKIRSNPLVAEMVPNVRFNAFDDDNDDEDEYNRDADSKCADLEAQENAPRHLARLSCRSQLPYDFDSEEYEEAFNYYYDRAHQGQGVNAYVIDTGVYHNREEFQHRIIFAQDFTGEGPGDLNGHGTHVAGIIGSKSFGVAKKVNIIDVKALNSKGQGNLTTVISSIEFAIKHCMEKNDGKACVANLSLGSMRNNVINQAVKAAFEAGLLMVTAAGNSNINACWTSPASAHEAIAVGAFDDRTDTIAKFSNWGQCVDVFASGVKVKSLSNKYPFEPVSLSGTSMSSPSITGLCAILLNKGVDIGDIKKQIVELATDDILQKRTLFLKPGTQNKIAFNGVTKEDDEFENAIYPLVDIDSFIEVLQNYQPSSFEHDFDISG